MKPSVYKTINEVHIEITNMCNLSCSYCYAETIIPSKKDLKNLFTNDLYRNTISKLLSESRSEFVDIVFHGGEPLLHGAEWFEDACSFATFTARKLGKIVYFSMQSNLTILRDAHIAVFRKHNVKIGVSLDGDEETHNSMRGKFSLTASNIKKLQAHDLISGVIVVVSHHNWDKVPSLFYQLRDMGIGAFHMNIASSVGRGNPMDCLGASKTFRAFKDSVDSMLYFRGELIDTRMIKKLQLFVQPPQKTEDTFQELRCDNLFCHAGVTMVAVQNDGNVFPCGCAGSSGNMKNFKLDNLATQSETDSLAFFSTLKSFHQKKEKYYQECVNCPAKFVCEHGCPAFDHTDGKTPEYTCQATKQLYRYLQSLDRNAIEELVYIHESKALAPAK